MQTSLYARLALIVGGFLLLGLLVGGVVVAIERHNAAQQAIGEARAKAQCTADKLAAREAQAEKDRKHQQQLAEATHEAEQRAARLAADVRALSEQLDRMRVERQALRARIAQLSGEAARHVADTAVELLGRCQERYSAVAADADRCLSDRQTLIDSWPSP